MRTPLAEIEARVARAVAAIGATSDPQVFPSKDPRFGDYQSNCAMGIAKKLGRKPRDVASDLVAALDVLDVAEPPEIAGPGFVNFRIRTSWLERMLSSVPAAGARGPDRLGMARGADRGIAVVDLSSPNLAKEMHVGHLRSTVIGNAVANLLAFEGHEVIRENHVGDWGTQFGMLVAFLRRTRPAVLSAPDALVIEDLESFYVEAKRLFDSDEGFRTASQETVVSLQSGDEATRKIWRAFCDESLRHCHAIYERLGIELVDRGESYYNDRMPEVVERLRRSALAVESDGALCVFLDGFQTREGEPLPFIIRKRDGGYNYATSDLATLAHRVEALGAKRIVYVVGLAQKLHFDMLFAVAREAGIAPGDVALHHLGFGNMVGPGGKPFKTREGGTVKLRALLDEAVTRARAVVEGTSRELDPGEIDEIAEAVGIGAVTYFDLSHGMAKDYVFDLDTMLSLEGNTAPYMMYAYARIRSIGRKAGVDLDALGPGEIRLAHESELALGKTLARLPEALALAGGDLRPNVLTEYLYELSRMFSRFYDRKLGVRVVDADEPERASRLRLAALTARALGLGLSLLGIRTLERM